MSSSTISISVQWKSLEAYRGSPILGYHLQRRGAGRGCVDWINAGRKYVLEYDQVALHGQVVTHTATIHGLSPDSSVFFRIRARTSGGWGEFSAENRTPFRTRAVILSYHFQDDLYRAGKRGIQHVINLMTRSPSVGLLQRLGCEKLSKMLWNSTW